MCDSTPVTLSVTIRVLSSLIIILIVTLRIVSVCV